MVLQMLASPLISCERLGAALWPAPAQTGRASRIQQMSSAATCVFLSSILNGYAATNCRQVPSLVSRVEVVSDSLPEESRHQKNIAVAELCNAVATLEC